MLKLKMCFWNSYIWLWSHTKKQFINIVFTSSADNQWELNTSWSLTDANDAPGTCCVLPALDEPHHNPGSYGFYSQFTNKNLRYTEFEKQACKKKTSCMTRAKFYLITSQALYLSVTTWKVVCQLQPGQGGDNFFKKDD